MLFNGSIRSVVFGLVAIVLSLDLQATARAQGQDQGKVAPPAPPNEVSKSPQAAPGWAVTCFNSKGILECSAIQSLAIKQPGGGSPRIDVAVHISTESRQPEMLLGLPLGLYLPAGVSLQFGGAAGKRIAIETCALNGCMAKYPISGAEISAMARGDNLKLSVTAGNKQPVTFTVPSFGFAAAYQKVTSK